MAKFWMMPKWMEKYIPFFAGYVKEEIEAFVTDRTPVQINYVRAMVAVQVTSQVELLIRLHEKKIIE